MTKWISIGLLCYNGFMCNRCFADATVRLKNVDAQIPLVLMLEKSNAQGEDFYIEVLGGPVGGTLMPIAMAGTNTTRIKLNPNGFFDGGIGVIPGVKDNGWAEFRVRVWRGLPTYDLAYGAGLISGFSASWQQKVGSWDAKTGKAPIAPVLQIVVPSYFTGYLGPVPPLTAFGVPVSAPKPD